MVDFLGRQPLEEMLTKEGFDEPWLVVFVHANLEQLTRPLLVSKLRGFEEESAILFPSLVGELEVFGCATEVVDNLSWYC
jgi:hypothetical protein